MEEDNEVRVLVDRLIGTQSTVETWIGPMGNVNSLVVGYVVLDNSGLHLAKKEVVIDRDGLVLQQGAGNNKLIRWTDGTTYAVRIQGLIGTDWGYSRFATFAEGTSGADVGWIAHAARNLSHSWQSDFDITSDTAANRVTEGYAGTDGNAATMANDETVFNERGADVDFRIEGDTVTDVFKVDAGADQIHAGTSIAIKERAAAQADIAGYGQLWVKNTTPTELWFTSDTGVDTKLA